MNQKTIDYRKKLAESFCNVLYEKGLGWKKTWTGIDNAPVNAVTNRRYNGINCFFLSIEAAGRGYNDPRWATFKQITDNGWHLKKGSKGFQVEFWHPFNTITQKSISWPEYVANKTELKPVCKIIPKYYYVFNATDIEGIPERQMPLKREISQDEIISKIETNMHISIYHDGNNRAFYRPSTDSIHLPEKEYFHSDYAYNATALHELAHATGAEHRLNRGVSNSWGSEAYAREELVAEITSAFTASELQVMEQSAEHINNHEGYVASWLKAIEDKPEALFEAIRDAEKAANYLDYKAELITEQEYESTLVTDEEKKQFAYDKEHVLSLQEEHIPGKNVSAAPTQLAEKIVNFLEEVDHTQIPYHDKQVSDFVDMLLSDKPQPIIEMLQERVEAFPEEKGDIDSLLHEIKDYTRLPEAGLPVPDKISYYVIEDLFARTSGINPEKGELERFDNLSEAITRFQQVKEVAEYDNTGVTKAVFGFKMNEKEFDVLHVKDNVNCIPLDFAYSTISGVEFEKNLQILYDTVSVDYAEVYGLASQSEKVILPERPTPEELLNQDGIEIDSISFDEWKEIYRGWPIDEKKVEAEAYDKVMNEAPEKTSSARRYILNDEGKMERLFRGKQVENFTERDTVQFTVDTEISLNGQITPRALKVLEDGGYKYDAKTHLVTKIEPIGSLDYYGSDGNLAYSTWYYDEEKFIKTIQENDYYGVPSSVKIFKDAYENTIPLKFTHGLELTSVKVQERTVFPEETVSQLDKCGGRYHIYEHKDSAKFGKQGKNFIGRKTEKGIMPATEGMSLEEANKIFKETYKDIGRKPNLSQIKKIDLGAVSR